MKKFSGLNRFTSNVMRWFATQWFWRLTIILFVLQAAYVALVGRFSMAFDEYYHLGSIQAYAKVWLPWSVQQPAGPATIGAVPADGSYLYHYLMSFPYRILLHITSSTTVQLVTLRLMDIVFVVVGLYVFRRLLLRLGMSRSVTHGLLWILTVLPMTPFLAGQLTYDTLWFTMTAVTMLALVNLIDAIQRQHILPLRKTVWVISLMLLTSQVKYAFLPMALAGAIFLVVLVAREIHAHTFDVRVMLQEWRTAIRTPLGVGVVVLLLVSGIFFGARYGSNMIKYHNPVPACDAVLDEENCLAYGPYARDKGNRDLELDKRLRAIEKVSYPFGWFTQMMRESYFAVGPMQLNYPTGVPLPVAYWTGFGVAVAGVLLLFVRIKQLWRDGVYARLLIVSVSSYVAFLFLTNFQAFISTGAPVAIHGRYLLPLLPMLGYLLYVALRSFSSWRGWRRQAVSLFVLFIVITTYGGGITPFIIRSTDGWYWPAAVPASKTIRSVLWPLIVR